MVSIIIPSYNRKEKLLNAIKSVLNQSYTDIEVIIVDDGSTDGTEDAISQLNDSRIIYVQQNHLGACAARNKGIEYAHGEYIAFHDSDDLCKNDRIEIQLKVLKKQNADMVCGNTCLHNSKGSIIRPAWPEGWIKSRDNLCNIGTITFFAKREVFENIKFDPAMPRWQDLEILLRIFKKYKIYFTEEILVDYYIQEDSISNSPKKCIDAFELLMQKYPDIYHKNKFLYGTLLKYCAASKIEVGREDYVDDFKEIYKCLPNTKNFLWKLFANMGVAKYIYKLAKKHFEG